MKFEDNFLKAYLEDNFGIKFNKQQQVAIEKTSGNTLLLAVAGSGKTTVMVTRIASLIHNEKVSARDILTLSFSVSSARDMKAKYCNLFGELGGEIPSFSTIHSFCFSVLKRYAEIKGTKMPELLTSSKGKLSESFILRQIYMSINKEAIAEDILSALISEIGYIKNMCIKSEIEIKSHSDIFGFYEIYREYEEYKLKNKLMDFDDMLVYTYNALLRYPALLEEVWEKSKYINIDEAQDTSLLQHKIIKLINQKYQSLFMVGDEDQSIYSFRGAYPKALLDFEKEFNSSCILKMEENFRSKEEIISCANNFISYNKNRYDKKMIATKKNETKEKCVFPIELDCQEIECSKIYEIINQTPKDKTIGILYRNNHSALALCEYLDQHKLEFKIKDHKSYFTLNAVIRDIIRFFELAIDMSDFEAFSSVFFKTSFKLKRSLISSYSLAEAKGENLFDSLYYGLREDNISLAEDVLELEELVRSLNRVKPYKAINIILNDIGYINYLKYKNSYRSYNFCLQKIAVLKSLIYDCENLKDALYKLDSIEAIISAHTNSKSNITLSTAHSSKGLEFDVVIVIDLFEGVFPSVSALSSLESESASLVEEEARLFYVAITRAREKLYLLTARKSCGDFINKSRFLDRLFSPAPKGLLFQGDKVRHYIFGDGEVLEVNTRSNSARVFFGEYGERKISLDILGGNKLYKINPKENK